MGLNFETGGDTTYSCKCFEKAVCVGLAARLCN